jgi:hypothetical protein
MLIFTMILGAIVAVTYLFQFQAYANFNHIDLVTDLIDKIGLPVENELGYEILPERQPAQL